MLLKKRNKIYKDQDIIRLIDFEVAESLESEPTGLTINQISKILHITKDEASSAVNTFLKEEMVEKKDNYYIVTNKGHQIVKR